MTSQPPSPTVQPRLPMWVRILLTLAVFAAAPAAPMLVLALLPDAHADFVGADDAAHMRIALLVWPLALVVFVGGSMALVRWADRRPVGDLGLRPGPRALIALVVGTAVSVAIAAAATAGWLLVEPVLASPAGPATAEEAALGAPAALAQIPAWLLLAYILVRSFVLQGIGEEVLMRGYLLQSLRSRPRRAVFIAAVVFTLPHLGSSGGQQGLIGHLSYLTIPFGFSLTAAALGILLRSVWAAAGIHGGFHLGMAVLGVGGAPLTSPWMFLILGAAHVLVGLVLLTRVSPARWAEVAVHGPYAHPVHGSI
ncbi:CPBP family intramembrane metalloprotease [Helcobacillus massiliensis]|uniref:CPBP family intramembrane glutamic endopeptidase n=1 Tax=Helcobacillus TaxID=1161125 RepID=UPI001EF49BF6|nr:MULTISPECIES: CPBP family intramembrane glutamic endopeptidase [Helcobacillus]MCG7426383.1 CPBP family intramembrane metalloprotease [Helcobacillus sp. ACRRO]MCT1558276.1 CPBP family intramembrane metalloprotease [Helcobacillus massiliensis]MCT2035485.1 CPBP family intramembrane metalloprotease [Helcobacillus massiliensis]MCT2332020.1 CPBP family intramembrane metalloprotease [Helcobacillus massiliensis]